MSGLMNFLSRGQTDRSTRYQVSNTTKSQYYNLDIYYDNLKYFTFIFYIPDDILTIYNDTYVQIKPIKVIEHQIISYTLVKKLEDIEFNRDDIVEFIRITILATRTEYSPEHKLYNVGVGRSNNYTMNFKVAFIKSIPPILEPTKEITDITISYSDYSPQGGSKKSLYKKTPEKVTLGSQTRVVYTNKNGTKFIKQKGAYVLLSKARKQL